MRAKTLLELRDSALFYTQERPFTLNEGARKILSEVPSPTLLNELHSTFLGVSPWSEGALEEAAKTFSTEKGLKLGQIAQPLRACLSGSNTSPGIFEVMEVLGRQESLDRIQDQLGSGA